MHFRRRKNFWAAHNSFELPLIRRRIVCKISGFIEDCVSKTCCFFSSPVNLLDQRSSEATNRTSQYFCCSRDGRRFSEEGRGSDNFLLPPESTTLYPPIETTFEFVIIIILFFVLFFCSGSSLSFSLSRPLRSHTRSQVVVLSRRVGLNPVLL